MSILSGVEERLLGAGYNMSFIRTGIELNDSKILFNTFNEPITGLILMESLDHETYEYIRKRVPYIVGIDTERGDIDNVGYDHYNVASMAVSHLIEKGHTRIGYIGERIIEQSQRQPPLSGLLRNHACCRIVGQSRWVIDCMWDEAVCIEKSIIYVQPEIFRPPSLPAAI